MAEPVDGLQAKLAQLGLDSTPEEFVASLPVPVQRRVEALRELQKGKDAHDTAFRKERAELEAKYEKLYAPLYEERREIVAGSKAVPAVEGEAPTTDDDEGIPEFWLTILLKCELTQSLISEKDVDVLKYLTNITSSALLTEDGAPNGFSLHFHFATNPYFSHPVLEKSYFMLAEDDAVLEKAEGTKIAWNAGKDVTVKLMKKKARKGAKDTKPQTKIEKIDSFFNFFTPPLVPEDDAEMAEEEAEQLQGEMEADYEYGIAIKEKLIPDAVDYYTGDAVDDDDYGYGEDDEDDDEDEDGDEGAGEEDEDEDEDDEEPTPPKGKGGKGGKKGGGGAAAGGEKQPPECKQQ